MSSRRHATRAVTAAAGLALVGVAGFGLLVQPHAAAAGPASSNDICIVPNLICIPSGGSSTPAPSSSSPAGGGTSSATTSATSQPTDQPSPTVGDEPTLYSTGSPSQQATQAATTGPAPGPNLAVSHLIIRKLKGKLDVQVTVANTGTVLLQGVPLSVSASGVGTQFWTVTLNPGQHLSFHTRWGFRATPRTKRVVVTIDPQHLVAETTRADDRISGTKTFR